MSCASFRFYEELNDFLASERRKVTFSHWFNRSASVKDMIESFGVPHTEVELILANGLSVDFAYRVRNGDRISVFPMFESLDISPLLRLRPGPLRDPRFVLDANLGRLARYLRLLGFDCLYRNNYQDDVLARISSTEHRILLTRDRRLLRRKIITHGYFVREVSPRRQVSEVMTRFDLYNRIQAYTRCARCNGVLGEVDKGTILDLLEPRTRLYYDRFKRCVECSQIYWKGSHHAQAQWLLDPPAAKPEL